MEHVDRKLIHVPDSWMRLINLIKMQASSGNFIFLEAPFAAGKSTFAEILIKKLTINDEVEVFYQKLHPLVTTDSILSQFAVNPALTSVVILDDAAEVEATVLEKLISTNNDSYYVILSEPELVNRVPRLQNSRFNLPLFNKQDCHKLLSKMYQFKDPTIEIPLLESELVYYESKGFPAEIIKIGERLSDKFKRHSSGVKSFDIANKGIFSTAVLLIGFVVLATYLFWPSDKKDDKNNVQNQPNQISNELPINIESSEGTVDAGELLIEQGKKDKPLSFNEWVAKQDPEHYTIQLYSNPLEFDAKSFKDKLDLADSYLYPVNINAQLQYRVVWGVYPNRARAQLAIQSLPAEILKQKPWLRSFKSIQEEL
ncbi:SPOR domain-containing protein [Kangiella sp. HZ709]|uniref:SPOR domain-containing protein n=1 Tax=Kangiella sp. HZ709 TaxID=2666328 RepID=UPI0012AF9917|nr:SPOR domain-containing protein [Kangiella sp. HZ709]MRX27641.1 hypothetical protein [Kangiella sp. HZ709]